MKKFSREDVSAQVARIFREERETRGLSLTLVGERAGLSHQMVSFVEREMRSPTLDTMLRIAEALEVELGDVVTRAQRAARSKSK